MKKRIIINQKYENYWKLTLEYTDYTQKPFNDVLSIIVDYIDKFVSDNDNGLSSDIYQNMQKTIEKLYPKKNSASTRKSINQFFKLGFINNYGKSYHYLTNDFLRENDPEQKKLLFSKIMYENASFNRSYTKPSNTNEIKFLINTLEECGTIDKNELLALIYTDINNINKGYLTKDELHKKYVEVISDNADERKYNQCSYLFGLCKTLTDIYVKNNIISLKPIIELEQAEKSKVRDPYLQHLYKIELINEYKNIYNTQEGSCVLEGLAYPILIASHIKPYKVSEQNEKFDKNNGLLLSKNMDSLFDLGYITFNDKGEIITSSKLNLKVAQYVKQFSLDSLIYTAKRQEYMNYHRKYVFQQ